MSRLNGLAGPAVGAAAFVVTAGLAFDGGGFQPVSWGRWLVALAALTLLLLLLSTGRRPGPLAAGLVLALALLTAWTAASWLWSESPPRALEEAQRTALYLAGAAAVVAAGRRAPLAWLLAGVGAGVVPAAGWNLALRLAPDWTGRGAVRTDVGQLADPVGYANSLALLGVVGLLLLVGLAASETPRPLRVAAAALLVPLAADVAVLDSSGAVAALAAALVAWLLVAGRAREQAVRLLALLSLPLVGAVAVHRTTGVVSPRPWDLLAAAQPGHRLLLALALLTAAQVAAAAFLLPRLLRARVDSPVPVRAAVAVALLLAVAALAAAPFALRGHERGHYWRAAVHEVRADPLLGSGAGTYVNWWLRTRGTTLSTVEAHSLYLETLGELGPVGLVVLLAALAIPLAAALRLRRTAWGPPLLAVFVAYDVHAAVDFDWELAAATLPVFVLGAAAAVHAQPDGEPASRRIRTACAAAAVVFAAAAILALAGSAPLASAHDAQEAGRYATAAADASRALDYAPWSAEAWRVIARSRLATGDRSGAQAAYREAVRLDPNEWQTWAALAAVTSGEERRSAEAKATLLNPLGSTP